MCVKEVYGDGFVRKCKQPRIREKPNDEIGRRPTIQILSTATKVTDEE